MNPSPAAIAAIRAQVTDWTPNDTTIAANLNAPTVANPVSQATVSKPFGPADLIGCLDAATLSKLTGKPTIVAIVQAALVQDRPTLTALVALGVAAGDLTTTQQSAIDAVLAASIPDPSWQAQIGWAQANLGRPVDSSDIAASRPGV